MALRPALVALTSGLAVIASGLTVPLTATTATAAERTVTVVGSLQDELGCSGDWQPDCAKTELTRDGDSTAYRAVFDVPAGTTSTRSPQRHLGRELRRRRRQERREHPARARGPREAASSPTTTRPTASASPRSRSAGAGDRRPTARWPADSLREPLTRSASTSSWPTGSPTATPQRPAAASPAPPRDRLRPHRQGLLPRRRPQGPDSEARLHQGPRHHRDLADAVLQEPARAGQRRQRERRLPRLLDHRLHPDRPAPRHQRRHEDARSTRPTPRASRSSSTSSPTTPPTSSTTRRGQYSYVAKATEPYRDASRQRRSTTATTPAAGTFPALDPGRRSPTRRCSAPTADAT